MIRLANNDLSKALHLALYNRMVNFALAYTPEFPAEPVVNGWLNRLFLGDDSLHIIVDIDDKFRIFAHAVVEVQEVYGRRTVICYQVQGDKNSVTALQNGLEYIEKLAYAVGAYSIGFNVVKNIRALEKLGFQVFRTCMFKILERESEEDELG